MRFETQGWDLTFKGGGEEGNEKEEKISHMSKSSAQKFENDHTSIVCFTIFSSGDMQTPFIHKCYRLYIIRILIVGIGLLMIMSISRRAGREERRLFLSSDWDLFSSAT